MFMGVGFLFATHKSTFARFQMRFSRDLKKLQILAFAVIFIKLHFANAVPKRHFSLVTAYCNRI